MTQPNAQEDKRRAALEALSEMGTYHSEMSFQKWNELSGIILNALTPAVEPVVDDCGCGSHGCCVKCSGTSGRAIDAELDEASEILGIFNKGRAGVGNEWVDYIFKMEDAKKIHKFLINSVRVSKSPKDDSLMEAIERVYAFTKSPGRLTTTFMGDLQMICYAAKKTTPHKGD